MSQVISGILKKDRQMHVWWTTEVECASTLARLERDGTDSAIIEAALTRLAALREDWNEISPGDSVRVIAERLLRIHPLRSADASQLAAALVLADGEPRSVTFLSFDDRLRQAARLEGLILFP